MKKLFPPLIFFLLLTIPSFPILAAPPPPDEPLTAETTRTTPQLIEAAFQRGEIDRITADLYLAYALFDYASLPAEYHSPVPWDGTAVLLQLQQSLQTTISATAAVERIQSLLSGYCSGSGATLPNSVNTSHFYIEYDTITGTLTLDDYISALETTWTAEVAQFGWAAPPVYTLNPPPGGKYHVRIDPNLQPTYYGYVSSFGTYAGFVGDNPNTTWNEGDAYASCMVLQNDYSYSGFPSPPLESLQATVAHEFNHALQYGYGALRGSNTPDTVFVEGGATWMEDEVFDAANDNYYYLWPQFTTCMGEYTAFPYSYWITFRGLTEPYSTGVADGGEQVLQDFWELTSQNASSNLSALNAALGNKGTSLADAYHAAAIALKFNKPCGGGVVSPYCLEEGAAYVALKGQPSVQGSIAAIGNSYFGSVADNYALNWVSLPTNVTPYNITLQNTSNGGQLRGSVVCDTGTSLNIVPLPAVANAGDTVTLNNFNPAACTSVVAVLTNQAQTAPNPSSCLARSYTLHADSAAPAPILANLPNQSLLMDTPRLRAIDLWNYASDDVDTPAVMSYTVINTPIISAGVSISANRYIDIAPLPGWTGSTPVDVQVQDTGGLTDTDTFTVTVKQIYKILLFPIFNNYTFP